MTKWLRLAPALGVVTIAMVPPLSAQHATMPPGMTHAEHLAQIGNDEALKKRGAAAMGFDQDKTAHHFVLKADGGRIEVVALDGADHQSRDQIRAHLKDIAAEFSAGRFEKPFLTHAEEPPGAGEMTRRRRLIAYRYEDIAEGGRVVITTRDRPARAAIHEFLRYQIREHATGDPVTVTR